LNGLKLASSAYGGNSCEVDERLIAKKSIYMISERRALVVTLVRWAASNFEIVDIKANLQSLHVDPAYSNALQTVDPSKLIITSAIGWSNDKMWAWFKLIVESAIVAIRTKIKNATVVGINHCSR
jgi:hypothetical protein